MWGKMILAMNMLCLLAFYVRGEHACLRVIGVKSPFVAVGTPELENSETFLRSADRLSLIHISEPTRRS